MKVYRDVFNGDELLSDSVPVKEDGVCFVAEGKYGTRSTVGSIDIGAASGVEGEEGEEETGAVDSATVSVLDIVDAHRLVETSYDKKNYTGHIKAYLKRLSERVPADDRSAWQEKAQTCVKAVLADFESYRFFTGESMDPEAMVVLLKAGEAGGAPYLYYFGHGLKTEVY
ncbi:translationally-controlled tumor protein [Kitasatospora sp. NPDC091335]|uniref:translationally-controlled tumor protein n=1 Tax=Kitasatospora sp. NPDC091335 TaxID=3364085 RepID=UPI003808DAE0